MAHLQDLEELLSSIHSTEIRAYMREAVSCYMAGAYRACIVLTFISLFDDITKKLTELGKINKKARALSQEVEKRKNEQDVFESYLLDQLKASNLIPAIDHEFYEILKKLRNKSAHPSGHLCSAEEARFVMFEAISRFMKYPNFSTTQICDEILARINDENFFPSNLITHTAEVVKKEIESVHEDAIPYLIEKIIDKYSSSDSRTSRNCEFFINGLAKPGEQKICKEIRTRLIDKKITNTHFHPVIFSAICANAKVIEGIHSVTLARIKPILSQAITSRNLADKETLYNHPTAFFRSLIIAGNSDLIINELKTELNSYLDKFPYSKPFLKLALPQAALYDIVLKGLLTLAGSSTFTTANSFAEHIEELDEIIGDTIRDSDSFEMIARIDDAAETGAWGSIRIRNANFLKLPRIREKAAKFALNEPSAAEALCSTINKYRGKFLNELTTRLQEPAA